MLKLKRYKSDIKETVRPKIILLAVLLVHLHCLSSSPSAR